MEFGFIIKSKIKTNGNCFLQKGKFDFEGEGQRSREIYMAIRFGGVDESVSLFFLLSSFFFRVNKSERMKETEEEDGVFGFGLVRRILCVNKTRTS